MSYSEKRPASVANDGVHEGYVTGQLIEHSHDADAALKAFSSADEGTIHIDEQTNRRLLRRIDLFLMPMLCIVYGLNYLDKTTLSYASVMGLKEDIGLSGDEYQWLGSIFYFGYLAFEYPTNRLLQRLPLAKYSAVCVILWGIILACFAAVKDYSGALAVRFFLGVCEAAVTPGFALFTSQWYTKKEQGTRTGIWFSFNGWAQIIGGFIAYGVAVAVEKHPASIAGWQIIFVALGSFTTFVGIIFLLVMPDNQLNAIWLKKEDRILAVERIRVNQQGIGNHHFKMYQLREALLDPAAWAITMYALIADIPNGGLTNFFSQLLVSFGFTKTQSLLYGTPAGAIEVVTIVVALYLGDKLKNRLLFGGLSLTISLIGIILIVALPLSNNTGRLVGFYLTQASATPFVVLLSFISSNIAGYTKKTTVAAMYLIGYCVGNIIGPQTFRPKDGPRYVPAEITIIVCYSVCLCILGLIYFWYRLQNARKAQIREQPQYVKLPNQEWLDLTDRENPEFVYTL